MNRIVFGAIVALLVITVALPALTRAGADGPSATGTFQFTLEDGQPRFLEFNAREQNNGRVVGGMTFSDPNVVAVEDPDATPGPANAGALVQAKFDCLKITGNRAVMGGVISQSNILSAVGLRVLLVVEDNGEGINAASTDKLTWGIYNRLVVLGSPKTPNAKTTTAPGCHGWQLTSNGRMMLAFLPIRARPSVAKASISRLTHSWTSRTAAAMSRCSLKIKVVRKL